MVIVVFKPFFFSSMRIGYGWDLVKARPMVYLLGIEMR